jgi:hypothetical protein
LTPEDTSWRSHLSSFGNLAFLIEKHRANQSFSAEDSKLFMEIVDLVVKKYQKQQVYSLILIDCLKEFDNTACFDELRKYAISKAVEIAKSKIDFLPSYMLSEARHCAKEQIDCPKHVRGFLLNVSKWYKIDKRTSYLLRKELEEVLAETQKLFGTVGSTKSDLVRFLASLYFVTDMYEQFHSVPIFIQLAQ